MKSPDLSATETPYVVIGTAPADPGAIDLADFPGLLAVTVTNGTPATVISYWSSEEHFARGGASFLKGSGVTEVSAEHHVQRNLVRGKRLNLWPWFLAILGVLGTLEGLRAHHDWLLRKPSLVLESQRDLPLNWHAFDEFSEVLRIENRTLVAHDDLTVETPLLKAIALAPNAGGPMLTGEVAASPNAAPILAAGDSMQVRIHGTAPRAAGDYELAMTVWSHAGVLRSRRGQPITLPVRVWSDIPSVVWFPPQKIGKVALFTGELLTGKAAEHGVRCDVTLSRNPEITTAIVSGSSVNIVSGSWNPDSGADAVSTFVIQSDQRPEFGRTLFLLTLSPLSSDRQLVDITNGLGTTCSKSPGGTS